MQTVIYYINKLKVSCEHSYSKYIFSMYLINIPTFQNSGSLFPHSKRQTSPLCHVQHKHPQYHPDILQGSHPMVHHP